MTLSENAYINRDPLTILIGKISGLASILISSSFWILVILSSYLEFPPWLTLQYTWYLFLFLPVVLAIVAALLRSKTSWVAIAISLLTLLFAWYAAGV
jgi:hypothetical protein